MRCSLACYQQILPLKTVKPWWIGKCCAKKVASPCFQSSKRFLGCKYAFQAASIRAI
ncbi:hypothetical protein GCWU000324_02348 [Kingella oralis ATCC 51147]|uniref:Uncharacterized protein n=1 Tax=Kingella oralis ATCC 51147 TaxID=629741 RepID=C4GJX3_9NEIS|nr:hypothetical protein GCWU000324_02348 [Kingella oralis ATCC 51147]